MTAPDPGATATDNTGRADSSTSEDLPGEGLDEAGLRKELKRARDEAVKFRQRAREFGDDEQYKRAKDAVAAVEKAEQEKKSEVERLSEKSEGLLHRAASAEHDLVKLRVALAAGVSPDQVDEFASRLRGDDEAALKADAEQLSRFFNASTAPARRGDPSQGAGGTTSPVSDPLQTALESKLGIG